MERTRRNRGAARNAREDRRPAGPTIPRANSTQTFREAIEESGVHVLEAVVPRRESYAQAFGARITDLGPYTEATDEILEVLA